MIRKIIINKKIANLISISLFIALALFVLLYAVADITTSVQTYHLDNPNRVLCKIALVSINVISVIGCIFYFLKIRGSFKEYIKTNCFFIISIIGFCFCCILSLLINERDVSAFFTTVIYFVTFLTLSSYFSFAIKDNFLDIKLFKVFGLVVFYLYVFLCVFYFFYVLGKPMSSGGLRIPVISHVFFCCSLLPFLRQLCTSKEMAVIYLSFIPIMFLANKSSVLIITLMYVIYDFFHSDFVTSRKWLHKCFVPIIIAGLILLIVISNIWKGSFFYDHFSFESMILESGRLQNWSVILESMKTFEFKNYLFGRGIGATLKINDGVAAHNDFIEYLYDFGITGILCLLCFLIHLILKTFKYKDIVKKHNSILVLSYVLIIMSISSLFSNNNLLLSLSFNQQDAFFKEKRLLLNETNYWTISI